MNARLLGLAMVVGLYFVTASVIADAGLVGIDHQQYESR